MRQCSEHIKAMEQVREHVRLATMEMNMPVNHKTNIDKAVTELYYALIPEDERKKLTADYRTKMISLIDEDIKRSKEEFEKI